jgi:glycosyltransferase involved in cell wall biosynthesis
VNKLHTLIGIPVREDPAATVQTLARLREHTRDASIVLLCDGVDAVSRAALEKSGDARVLAWNRTLGSAACFNRLVQSEEADLYVLLENGALVAPHWLEHIRRALAADSSHGIAGPSTNRAWNEQLVFADLSPDEASLARAALDAEARFEGVHVPLVPLHSVGDFCYAVKREVVRAIGAADEGYGDGPCWEMDYNIRAARAGFTGVWVKSAVVWRMAPSAARSAAEARRLLTNKRRYQDHFCGLRLRNQSRGYDAHCTGEACAHFAPRELVITRREFGSATSHALTCSAGPVVRTPPPAAGLFPAGSPLVSCIMPTANRRPYVQQAIAAFLAQDYENRELIIVDDGSDSIENLVPSDARIHYVRAARAPSLGSKRNDACRLAQGEIIVHWDDDDWHAAWRLSYQVGALLAEQADICGLDRLWFYDTENAAAWQYVYHGRPHWLAGGTFCYLKSVWKRHPFANVSAGEDTRFVREAPLRKVLALARDDFYVARIHARNTCRKHTSGSCWRSVPATSVRALIESASAQPLPATATDTAPSSAPLVSCIMPTRDRPEFVPLAVELFQAQTYSHRELIVIDDGEHSVRELLPADDRIRYLRLDRRHTLGEKRNLACQQANGEFVVHWDDDDWYGPERLAAQLAPLIRSQADVSALAMTHVLSLSDMRFWRCRPAHHARIHYRDLCPGTLAYRRRLWSAGARYAAVNCAEDVAFLNTLPPSVRITRIPDEHHFVCVRHALNTWSIKLDWQRSPAGWQAINVPAFMPDAHTGWYREQSRRLGASAARSA